MNYLKLKENILYVDSRVENRTFKKYIDDIAKEYFRDLKGIRSSTKELFKIKKNIPLYISKRTILFPIYYKKYIIYFNYSNTISVEYVDDYIIIIFNNGEVLKLNITKEKYETLNKNIKKLCEYLTIIE